MSTQSLTLARPRRLRAPALAARTMALLQAGIPLTLLLDLAEPEGPRSEELYRREAGCAAWLRSA